VLWISGLCRAFSADPDSSPWSEYGTSLAGMKGQKPEGLTAQRIWEQASKTPAIDH
jgi:hypothetical protein